MVPTVSDMASDIAADAASENPYDPDNVTGTEVAVVEDKTVDTPEKPEALDPDWPYERLEYKGDNLAVRKPTIQALAAFQLSSGKFIDPERQTDITSLFMDRHLGPDTYDRIMTRLISPDEPEYTKASIGEIMGAVVRMAVNEGKDTAE
ncbi:Uncharacterised protein [Mycobacteroides abscessus subsp. abscessus]|nr:Uncharacterised protein [Mycobacteroides abscessus subsp. abscessus]SKO51044.1 Uncharacterised protein [Mycobacteroides abscessus subsp. abscessus]